MSERPGPRPPKYDSPLKAINLKSQADFDRVETFQGPVSVVLRDINRGIKKIEDKTVTTEDSLSLFYRTYELIKMTINEKVEIDRSRRDHDLTNKAIVAARLAIRLAIACDLHDPNAGRLLKAYRKLVGTTELKNILGKRLNETPDRDAMPDHPVEDDLEFAEQIVKQTLASGRRDIAVVGIGHQGTRREIDIYLDAVSLLESIDSRLWIVRSSENYGDQGRPNLCYEELDLLKKWVRKGRQLVIIGPEDRIEKAKAILEDVIPRQKGVKSQEAIYIRLPVVKKEDNNGKSYKKRRLGVIKGLHDQRNLTDPIAVFDKKATS